MCIPWLMNAAAVVRKLYPLGYNAWQTRQQRGSPPETHRVQSWPSVFSCTSNTPQDPQAAKLAQKSTSKAKPLLSSWPAVPAMTPAFWYSPTRFSKKLVFPCSEMSSIQSKGFEEPNNLE